MGVFLEKGRDTWRLKIQMKSGEGENYEEAIINAKNDVLDSSLRTWPWKMRTN